MTIVARTLDLKKDGMAGFIAAPRRAGRGPAILSLFHNHGVTDNLKQEAFEYAERGYTAFVPNLYHLLGHSEAHHLGGRGQEIQAVTSDGQFLEAIRRSWEWLVAREDVDGARLGVLGYCMGGRLAIPFAADTPAVRSLALFYPTIKEEPETDMRPRHAFKTARSIKCPAIVLYGGKDRLCTNEAQLKLWQAFMASGQPVEWHWYSWGDHGFTAPVSVGYQPDLARRARPLAFDFFDRTLKDAD